MSIPKTQGHARLLGLTKYRTGKPCKWGHISDRWTQTGSCCECTLEAGRRARADFAIARKKAMAP